MAQGTAEANLLTEQNRDGLMSHLPTISTHHNVDCPHCSAQFLLSVYLDDVQQKKAELPDRLKFDHEQKKPHREHIQL